MNYFHTIIKKKDTFDVADYPYTTTLNASSDLFVVIYYDDATLTAPSHTATYSASDYIPYVVPGT